MSRCAIALLWMIVLAACQPTPRTAQETGDASAAGAWPTFDYTRAAGQGQAVFRLHPQTSQINVVVRRDGPLARFGHDHVISARPRAGFLLLGDDLETARADLQLAVSEFEVDNAARRTLYGLDTEPDDEDIDSTRSNMLRHVLNAETWPMAEVSFSAFRSEPERFSATVRYLIAGSEFMQREYFRIELLEDRISLSGETRIRLTDLGLEPFSALGGGLRVADELEIHYQLRGDLLK